MFDSITKTVQPPAVLHRAGRDAGPADHECPVTDLADRRLEPRRAEAWKVFEHRAEQFLRAARSDDREVGPGADELRIEHGVEEKMHEIGEVVGVEMGKENVAELVPVHAGFHEILQRAGPEVEQEPLIGLDEIAGRGAGRVDVRAGAEDRQCHRKRET
jgi:hypothetical protein